MIKRGDVGLVEIERMIIDMLEIDIKELLNAN